ncbi:MAG: VWA domain-containing protein [Treponema sp.]|jgi:hypothetical protein|nr:VWA domain-containing protein [Treponema sp.]
MKPLPLGILLSLCIGGVLFSEGRAAQEAADPQPFIGVIPPQDIRIEEYITGGTYAYPPQAAGPVQVFTAADIRDTTGYLQIGLRGAQGLPPLNIAFVIDKSRSMEEAGRMDWVKDAFQEFIEQVRPEDLVSLVVFDTSAKVIIPPAPVQTPQDKQNFMRQVKSLSIGGRSDIYAGLALGYTQVAANYRRGYINRVICLTDGDHNGGDKDQNDILRLVETYHAQDITLSTIALGRSADLKLMADTALTGGGSSRFITDQEELAETFGSKLDRLLVPVARQLTLDLNLAEGVTLQETWGYAHQVLGSTLRYTLDALYNEDTETLVAEVRVDPRFLGKSLPLGTLYLEYRDPYDVLRRQGPYPIVLEPGAITNRKTLRHPWIQEAEGFIHFGRGLIQLGNQALAIHKLQRVYEGLKRAASVRSPGAFSVNNHGLTPVATDTEASVRAAQDRLLQKLQAALQEIADIRASLQGLRDTLGETKYAGELQVLKQYHAIFSHLYDLYHAVEAPP